MATFCGFSMPEIVLVSNLCKRVMDQDVERPDDLAISRHRRNRALFVQNSPPCVIE
ncbi:MAG: hypothetical protein ABR524_10605 [Thermoanaerobaculia bacterium]